MAQRTVTLQPGESKVIAFEVTPHEVKTFEVSVDGLTGSFKALTKKTNLYGVVTDAVTGQPLSRVFVILTERETGTVIGAGKRTVKLYQPPYFYNEVGYLFRAVPVGSYTIRFEKEIYYSTQREITLSEPRHELNVQLAPRPPAPELLGHIASVVIWHEPLSSWKDIYRTTPFGEEVTIDERLIEVPANSEIHIGVYWGNLSEVEITAHMDIIVDGQFPSAVRGQDVIAGPRGGGSMQFEPFRLQPGNHSLRVEFSSGGTLLDSWNTTLRAE